MKTFKMLQALAESDLLPYGIDKTFSMQRAEYRVFLAVYWCEAEIHQSGFLHCFASFAADAIPFLVQALDKIGASHSAATCKRAIDAVFPNGLPTSTEAIKATAKLLIDKQNAQLIEKLGSLDQEFFGHPDDLSELLFKYVQDHPDAFGALPSNLN
jgi:Domain of unknown function (DUF4375)